MSRIVVIGGGLTGQLLQYQMPAAVIYDWKAPPRGPRQLTRQYGGNYLWEPIGDIPCRSFPVITHIDGVPATLDSIVRYKQKIGKAYEANDPANNWSNQFRSEVIGYEFNQLPEARVNYGYRIVEIQPHQHVVTFANNEAVIYDVLVSSIPLYSLLSLMKQPEPRGRLQFKPICVKISPRPPDAPYSEEVMYLNYISDPKITPYRYTDREGERHYEALAQMGPLPNRRLMPGKIYAHPEVPAILEHLAAVDIYTFGRFGSWNPDELIHETWHRITEWKEFMGHAAA